MYRSFSNSINKRLVLIPLVAVVLMGMMSNAQDARAQEPSPEIAGLLQQIESLMQILISLQEQVAAMPSSTTNTTVAAPEGGFADQNLGTGSGVETTATLRVRANAGTQAAMVSSVPPNTGGTIIGGPQFANGYTWWNVQYGNGTQGWSAGNWLKSASNSSSGSTTGSESTTNDAAQTNTGSANFAVRINGVLDTSTNVTDRAAAETRCSSLTAFVQEQRVECYWDSELIGGANLEPSSDGEESSQDYTDNSETSSTATGELVVNIPNYLQHAEDGLTLQAALDTCNDWIAANNGVRIDCTWDGENIRNAGVQGTEPDGGEIVNPLDGNTASTDESTTATDETTEPSCSRVTTGETKVETYSHLCSNGIMGEVKYHLYEKYSGLVDSNNSCTTLWLLGDGVNAPQPEYKCGGSWQSNP